MGEEEALDVVKAIDWSGVGSVEYFPPDIVPESVGKGHVVLVSVFGDKIRCQDTLKRLD